MEPTKQATAERRRHPRVPAAWAVRVQVDEECVVARTADVSAYGVLVVSAPTAMLKLGQCYRVELMANMGDKLVAQGEVRHVSGKGAGLQMKIRLPI
jgi:hypothetical protein